MSLADPLPFSTTPPARCDSVWRGATLVTMQDGHYSLIENGAIVVADGKSSGSARPIALFSRRRTA
jgi:imidazolonepropionase